MKIIGIIPARMESSRLPGKPLITIGGKSMIRRVYESAMKANQINELYVATPNKEIFDHVNEFGKVIGDFTIAQIEKNVFYVSWHSEHF